MPLIATNPARSLRVKLVYETNAFFMTGTKIFTVVATEPNIDSNKYKYNNNCATAKIK